MAMPATHLGGTDRVEFAQARWPADRRQLATVRAAIKTWLRSLELNVATRDNLLLAVSEAASNVVRHAYASDGDGTVVVVLWTEPDVLNIEVADHGGGRQPSEVRVGLGVTLMRELVDAVSIRFGRSGTRVHLRHHLPVPSPRAASDEPRRATAHRPLGGSDPGAATAAT